ncbi:BACON domain-containing protein [Sphingobacterium faecale]|uniref:BACON domain-containing protein n=1 Tax=Sphingobacterium faecale TaxID=2803775 RepID=A0ABS1R7C7_9SPHI|nr:BACON domain-containing protein [Sphingobacterium faecale]MBL1410170.1 BACON domain-containing protein [Sphingobacterium faecale]
MKYYKSYNLYLVFAFVLFFSNCEKEKSESFLKRNVEQLSFDYIEESKEFTVRATGDWSIQIPDEDNWIKVEPQSGTGDGNTYQKVKVTCIRNTSEARKGTIYLSGSSQQNVPIKINQNNGLFEWATHSNGKYLALEGDLTVGKTITAKLKVPYRKAVGDEKFPVTIELSGKGATGINAPTGPIQVSTSGDGFLYIPLNGLTETQGLVEIAVKIDNQDFGTMQTIAGQGQTIIKQSFDNFLWGGDCIANKDGITSIKATAEMALGDETILCAVGTNGANGSGVTSTIRTSNPTFYKSIGLEGWLGVRNYMRPGYIQLGAASATATEFGSILTPALPIPTGENKDLLVTFKAALYNNPGPSSILVGLFPKAVQGVTLANINSLTNKVSIPFNVATMKWIEVSCVIKAATNASALTIMLPEDTNQNGTVQASRLYIDDIIVTY